MSKPDCQEAWEALRALGQLWQPIGTGPGCEPGQAHCERSPRVSTGLLTMAVALGAAFALLVGLV